MFLLLAAHCGAADLVIYSDKLANGFQDRSWSPRSLTNTSPVYSGKYSISASPTAAWQGLYFYHQDFDVSPYASVTFRVNGGPEGGQRLQILGLLSNDGQTPGHGCNFPAPTNQWQTITLPLAELGVADKTNCSGFSIQLAAGGATNTYYVDDIQLDAKPAPQAHAPAIAAAPLVAATPMPASAPAAVTPSPVIPAAAAPVPMNATGISPAWWIAGVLTIITVLLAWLILMLRRSGVGRADALAVVPATAVARRDAPASAEDWQQRARAAEAMATKQAQILSEKVIPEIKEFAKQSLVQGLFAQRNALLETQQRAQQELAQLEARLAELQLPLQGRILAYENRITELERELETRGDEMRELTRATLLLVRQKLEEEKKRENERSRFN
jgi:hypothetical protein